MEGKGKAGYKEILLTAQIQQNRESTNDEK
jgi:hypothetical protein